MDNTKTSKKKFNKKEYDRNYMKIFRDENPALYRATQLDQYYNNKQKRLEYQRNYDGKIREKKLQKKKEEEALLNQQSK